MIITNYGELKQAVADWLDRSDLTSKIPQFIQLAEDMIFRTLRCPGNEQMVLYSASNFDNTRYIQIPNDYLECKLLMYNNLPLTRVSDQRFGAQNYAGQQLGGRAAGIPTEFTRLKGELWFYPPADKNADVNLWFWESQGPLVNDTDWTRTLRYAPGLYLYGALLQAQAYLIGDERLGVWRTQFDSIMAELNEQTADDELAGSTTSVRNIYT